ncbi:MAG: FKBP-type peptidyl-prolyl cis-trans isomerase, partial [Candidatus Thiodiazotropha sp. (ex Gloverina cf. vestifex)]|nr:FKBP-type peptidyl-prolyl cis-trans isomerase [Candidatus Thiodiazotropha sp. (ex Gloverina cf. vestifex)]
MSNNSNQIVTGSQILLHLSMTLEDGTEVVSTYNDEPLSLTLGDGTMEAALEDLLIDLNADDEQNWKVFGDEVYGPNDNDNLQWVDRETFSEKMKSSVSLPRERFWDIRVPKIDSPTRQPLCP